MKKILFSLFSLLLAILAFSQTPITILNADMPRVNDTLRYSTSSSITAAMLTQAGANQIWNFSNMVNTGQDIQKHFAPLNTPYVLYFSGATYGLPDNINVGGLGGALGISFSDVYSFYKNTAGSSVMVGRGAKVQGLPIGMQMNPKDTIYKFPLDFGDVDSCLFKGSFNLPTLGSFSQQGKRVSSVDAWGTITTPYGTFSCIRIKAVINETDSILITAIPFPIAIPNNRTVYTWWAKGERFPILEVTVTSGGLAGAGITTRYKDRFRPEAFVNNARFTANKFVGTYRDTIRFTDQSKILPAPPKSWQWTITPNTFTYTAGTSATSRNPQVLFSTIGLYSVRLRVVYEGGSDDTLRSNCINIQAGPVARFGADITKPSIGGVVSFTDSSEGNPTSWLWAFSPNTVSYVGSTFPVSRNPKVVFNALGSYTVSLQITNALGNNTQVKTNYIGVFNTSTKEIFDLNKAIKVFPVPAKSILNLQSELSLKNAEINFYDILGKEFTTAIDWNANKTAAKIDIGNLNKGIYFIKIVESGKTICRKFVVD